MGEFDDRLAKVDAAARCALRAAARKAPNPKESRAILRNGWAIHERGDRWQVRWYEGRRGDRHIYMTDVEAPACSR